jgi:hypothetical protein
MSPCLFLLAVTLFLVSVTAIVLSCLALSHASNAIGLASASDSTLTGKTLVNPSLNDPLAVGPTPTVTVNSVSGSASFIITNITGTNAAGILYGTLTGTVPSTVNLNLNFAGEGYPTAPNTIMVTPYVDGTMMSGINSSVPTQASAQLNMTFVGDIATPSALFGWTVM